MICEQFPIVCEQRCERAHLPSSNEACNRLGSVACCCNKESVGRRAVVILPAWGARPRRRGSAQRPAA